MKSKILVIEDEMEIRNLLKRMIRPLHYEVILTGSADEAMEVLRFRSDEISLIILDLLMPEKSGWDIFPAIREKYPDIKILISSGFADIDKISEVLIAGKVENLPKPYTVPELRDKICRMMES